MLYKLAYGFFACFVLSTCFPTTGRSQESSAGLGFPPIVIPLCYKELPGQKISCPAALQERLLDDPYGENNPFGVVDSCEGNCSVGGDGIRFICQVDGRFQLEQQAGFEDEFSVYEPVASGGNALTRVDQHICIVGRKCKCVLDSDHPEGRSCAASLDPSDLEVYLKIDFLVVSTTPCQ